MLNVKELFNELKDNLFYPALIYISKNVIIEYSKTLDKSILLNYESVYLGVVQPVLRRSPLYFKSI